MLDDETGQPLEFDRPEYSSDTISLIKDNEQIATLYGPDLDSIEFEGGISKNELVCVSILKSELNECQTELSSMDYIGTKIATGRATKEEYELEIKLMNTLSKRVNEIKAELRQLEGSNK